MIKDYLGLAVRSMSHRQKRSWLTIIGILIGITAVVALVSLGQSMQRAVNKQFQQFGYNLITIYPGGLRGSYRGPYSATFELDTDLIASVDGVEAVEAMLYKSAYIRGGEPPDEIEGFLPVVGLSPGITKVFSQFKLEQGRFFTETDHYTAILGQSVPKDLGIGVGEQVEIEGQAFEVVGLLAESGLGNNNSGIFIPLEALWEILGDRGKVSMVWAKVGQGYDAEVVAERLKAGLKEARGKEDFTVQTIEDLQKLIGQAIGILQAFLGGIAGISLLVGGIGVMNTMYTAVLERTREIGVMKAVGAKDSHIMWLFLIESGFMGLVGGAIGTALGLGMDILAVVITKRFIQTNVLEFGISAWLVIGALAFSFVIGALSGLLPARSAAKLKPVEALRYE
ncbi:MAG: ABC transporter permease [Candidatus Acetothermia bacterium]|jgi:putative ABC transport system permease protein|nr:ABC transporter permease [Candidatus Acetothermia bacterium]MDH7504679.1 ABC transporter permease [Candidatus Acetothermia bacterium]